MDLIIELSTEEAEQLGLKANQKISFAQFRKLLAKDQMKSILDKSYADAVKHGYADMSMEEINETINEAKEEYSKQHGQTNP